MAAVGTDMVGYNVEDGFAPPWRCQDCMKTDKYAVQRVVEVLRATTAKSESLLRTDEMAPRPFI